MKRRTGIGFVLATCCAVFSAPAAASDVIVVGSKNFAENRLLAEMFARLIESRTSLRVERK